MSFISYFIVGVSVDKITLLILHRFAKRFLLYVSAVSQDLWRAWARARYACTPNIESTGFYKEKLSLK